MFLLCPFFRDSGWRKGECGKPFLFTLCGVGLSPSSPGPENVPPLNHLTHRLLSIFADQGILGVISLDWPCAPHPSQPPTRRSHLGRWGGGFPRPRLAKRRAPLPLGSVSSRTTAAASSMARHLSRQFWTSSRSVPNPVTALAPAHPPQHHQPEILFNTDLIETQPSH